ncbi:MAG: metallophosphoesterase family protein [Phormidesmis sp. CAN_BIN44]|nr:metallophosphoesterase family protein [Phormidesmis sp. CAN_BIN44]
MPHLSPQKSLKATLKKAAISLLGVERVKALQPNRLDQIHLAWVDDPATTLTIAWRTFKASTPSLVEYRAVGGEWVSVLGRIRFSGTQGALHEVTVQELNPATVYEYRVQGDDSRWSEVFSTRTAPPLGAADFDVIYFADTGLVGRHDGLTQGAQQVIDEIAQLKPLFVLAGGDFAYYKTDKRHGSLENAIDAWFNQMQPVSVQSPMLPTYGNHEVLLQENYDAWAHRFPTPQGFDDRRNYSFNVGDVHFISIFAVYNEQGLTSAQMQWLEQDILIAQQAGQRWILPFMHVSAFADGANHPSNLALRAQLGPLFERLGVKVVLSSHDQAYERTYPLVDVPATNTPTSLSQTDYTTQDGVTWVKTSPSGKLSNLNGSFSVFRTVPAPAWTACRSNHTHVFTRLTFSASGTLRVEAFGVKGNGEEPLLLDSFSYTLA